MTNDEPDRADDAVFDELSRSVAATVDVEAGLDDLHRRVHGSARRSTWIASIAAAAVMVGVVVGAGVLLGGDGDGDVISQGASSDVDAPTAPSVPEPTEVRVDECRLATVFLLPSATPEALRGIEALLAGSDAVESYEFVDEAATYEEFRRLFADQPDFVAAIRPDELPPSFRVVLADGAGSDLVDVLASRSEVLQVTRPPLSGCEDAPSGAAPAGTATTEPAGG